MIGISYSLLGILAIIIHCIINRETMFYFSRIDDRTDNTKKYQKFLWGILAYYITDAFWGVFDELGWISILKIDTFIYYIAMSVAVVFWCDYVVSYLQQNDIFGRTVKYIGRIFVIFEIIALIINIYKHFFFWFDENGTYHAGMLRYIALYVQIALFSLVAAQAIFVTYKSKGVFRRRHLSISLFSCAMIIAIIVQIFYPLLPIYSIGYLIGSCFLHVFVEEDEKDEHMEHQKKHMDMVSSMASIYFCSYYIDVNTKTYVKIDNRIKENDELIGESGNAIETLDMMCNELVLPQYKKEMQEFTNLNTLEERLTNKNYYISAQFQSIHMGWSEGYFIARDRNPDGSLHHVIWAIRTINDEKAKEEKLFYNSYIDELTGAFNRKMYMEDIFENLDKFMQEDFVFVSMDVNGLKVINDSQGHSAGDELIVGAAACMKEAFGEYGRVYRTGGDEFIAMLNIEKDKLEQVKEHFQKITSEFEGEYIKSISVSCGYVVWCDYPEFSIIEIEKQADKNMYMAKQAHYASKGIDRRGQQQNAFKALCALYTKILMVNLTEDKYSIISMNEDEQSEDKGFSDGIFEWLENFAKSGQVHIEDQELYLSKTSKEYLTDYFKRDKTSLSISYRRKTDGVFKLSEMEIIPAEGYSDDNQNVYLYVKMIDK